MQTRVILMHGKNTDPTQKWYPWFASAVRGLGFDYAAPQLPHADNPIIAEWTAALDDLRPDAETILVGHSRGGVAVLRWLEMQPKDLRIKKVILVAANSGFTHSMTIEDETNYGFYTDIGYDFEKIRTHCSQFVVLHSSDDAWVPYTAGQENAKGLHAKFLSSTDRGHFGKGVDEIPELVAEITHE